MADVHDSKTRSYNMSRIKGKDTKPELVVRKYLHAQGVRYRLHVKDLPGKPDLVLPKYKAVIFIHGCFWHAHDGCRYFRLPKARSEWWEEKLLKNRERDTKAVKELRDAGWRVFVVWECALKKDKAEETLFKLAGMLKQT
jgi:DNA mismatch endonuclease (patch repair protein)